MVDKTSIMEGTSPSGVEMIHTPIKFRALNKGEIDCRVSSNVYGGKVRLLLYKDARVDMNILDETVGCERWQREHSVLKGNLFCGVAIQQSNGEWVWKWDCGSEGKMEKRKEEDEKLTENAKAEASDSFKRACFAWGIGRELYTAPEISISLVDKDLFNGRLCQSFSVGDIEISSKHEITYLTIVDKFGKVRFTSGTKKPILTEAQKGKVVQRLAGGEDIWDKLSDAYSFNREELLKAVEKAKSGA